VFNQVDMASINVKKKNSEMILPSVPHSSHERVLISSESIAISMLDSRLISENSPLPQFTQITRLGSNERDSIRLPVLGE
jgi:hypothetical protein